MKRTTLVRGLAWAAGAALFIGLVHYASSKPLSDEERKAAERDIFKNGVPLDVIRARRWPGLEEWEDAVQKFPTIESCLAANRAGIESLMVNWDRISSDIEANVCLSRVATKIGTVEGLNSWFKQNRFRVVAVIPATKTSRDAPEKSGTAIHASWSNDTNGPLYKGGLLIWTLQRIGYVYGTSCSLFIGDRRTVFSTNCVSAATGGI